MSLAASVPAPRSAAGATTRPAPRRESGASPAPRALWLLGAAVFALHALLAGALWQWVPQWATQWRAGMAEAAPRLRQVVPVALVRPAPPATATPPEAAPRVVPPRPLAAPTAAPAAAPPPPVPRLDETTAVRPPHRDSEPVAEPVQVQVPVQAQATATATAAVEPAALAVNTPVTPVAPPPALVNAPPPPALTLAQADHHHCPQVPHPQSLRERGIEGMVHLLVRVSAEGQAAEVRVNTGSGWRLFDEAALLKARGCRFVPARRGGEPVESWVNFSVRFALKG